MERLRRCVSWDISGLLEPETSWKGHHGVTPSENSLPSSYRVSKPTMVLTLALEGSLRTTLTASLGRAGWKAMWEGSCRERYTGKERQTHLPPSSYILLSGCQKDFEALCLEASLLPPSPSLVEPEILIQAPS